MGRQRKTSVFRLIVDRLLATIGAMGMTLVFFLVLPLIQAINEPPIADLMVQTVDAANLPPPPPPMQEEEPPDDPEPEEPPPELLDEAPPLDLSQLEMALNPGFSGGWGAADFAVKLNNLAAASGDVDQLFSLADLDQKPRCVYQPSPVMTAKLRKKAPGKARVIFEVNQKGRVENPVVQTASDPIFERPAIAAVKKWKFEPGKRGGQAVRFRMRVTVSF